MESGKARTIYRARWSIPHASQHGSTQPLRLASTHSPQSVAMTRMAARVPSLCS